MFNRMADKEYLSAKVDSDSALYERFERVVEEEGYESKSEAVRALIRDGLDARDAPAPDTTPLSTMLSFAEDEIPIQVRAFGWMLSFTGAMLAFFELGVIGGPIWLVAAGFFALVALTNLFGIAAPLAAKFLPETESTDTAEDEVDA